MGDHLGSPFLFALGAESESERGTQTLGVELSNVSHVRVVGILGRGAHLEAIDNDLRVFWSDERNTKSSRSTIRVRIDDFR